MYWKPSSRAQLSFRDKGADHVASKQHKKGCLLQVCLRMSCNDILIFEESFIDICSKVSSAPERFEDYSEFLFFGGVRFGHLAKQVSKKKQFCVRDSTEAFLIKSLM